MMIKIKIIITLPFLMADVVLKKCIYIYIYIYIYMFVCVCVCVYLRARYTINFVLNLEKNATETYGINSME